MLTAISHTPDRGWHALTDLSLISNLCDQSGARVWAEADIESLTDADVATIAEEFGLHPLAVEDSKSMRERPKLEAYDKHLFVVVHEMQSVNGQLEPLQIACFIGTRFVLALHQGANRTMAEAKERLLRVKGEVWGGSAFLMHALLDAIVDDYQAIADELEEQIESLEETLLSNPRSPAQTALYTVKQRLARFRRYVFPVQRMLSDVVDQNVVAGAPIALTDGDFGAYFRDVLDHAVRIIEQTRNVEDLANAMVDLARVEATNAQNEVTKKLTGWAAIIAVPTFIASVYGMNFQLVPTDGKIFGFYFALGLMATTAITLYVYFKRRGWL